jgi:hypothetical protein
MSLLHRILFACGSGAARLFRQNTGVAWAGKRVDQVRGNARMVMCHPGDVVVRGAQPIRMGLCVGSSDIIGWKSRVMQPDDVGTRVAVFTAIEVKAEKGRVSAEQQQFIDAVLTAGGIAGVAKSEQDACALLASTHTL